MDCNHARLLLHFVRPGSSELDAQDLESLRQHLSDCPDCGATARAEKRFDEAVGQAMHAVPVPIHLRQRVLDRLAKDDPARRRRRVVAGLAAAAVLLLAAGVTWQVWPHRLEAEFDHHPIPVSRIDVQAWFQDEGISMVVPSALNFELLESYGIAVHQGKRVARLLYVGRSEGGRSAIAEVLVLSPEQFQIDPLPERISDGGRTMEAIKGQGFLFLVTHTGSLATFLNPQHVL